MQDLEEARGECNESRLETKRLAGEIGTLSGQLSASRAESIAAQATAQHLVQEHAAKLSGLEKASFKALVLKDRQNSLECGSFLCIDGHGEFK
jgi:hypothetical protein